jgi:ribosomal protein S18 acetylase RimI-like enzyme
MSNPKPKFTIARATLRDVPRLGELWTRSFDDDTNSQMKVAADRPGAWAEGMTQGARHFVKSSLAGKCAALKAVVDDGAGGRKIVGFSVWGSQGGLELDTPPADEGDVDAGADEEEPAKEAAADDGGAGEPEAEMPGAARISELQDMTNAHRSEYWEKMMPKGSKGVYIICVSVDPAYQGQGIGSALIRWGTAQADRFGVICMVHSSEAGWKAFQKQGFEVGEHLTFNLDEWAPRPPKKGELNGDLGKWGEYTFRYMVRQPVK